MKADFCYKWKRLTIFTEIATRKTVFVKWQKWFKKDHSDKYNGKILGRKIMIQTKKRENKEEFKENIDKRIIENYSGVKENILCQICKWSVNLDENLQCLYCFEVFWFSWLIMWVYRNNNWYSWRRFLEKSDIGSYNTKRQTSIELKPQLKLSSPSCNSHREEWTLYCKTCNSFICNKWIISKIHNEHIMIEEKELLKDIQAKVSKELNRKWSALQNRLSLIEKTTFMVELNNAINKKALNHFYHLLNKIEWALDSKVELLSRVNEKIKDVELKKVEENEKVLEIFTKTQEVNLISQTLESLDKIKNLRNENKKLQTDFIEEKNKYDVLTQGNLIKYEFDFLVSNKFYNQEYNEIEKDEDLGIEIKKHLSKNHIVISAKLKCKEQPYWYCKLVLEDKSWRKLKDKGIKLISSSNSFKEIGDLELRTDIIANTGKINIKFYIYMLELKTSIVKHERKIKRFIESIVFQNQHFKGIFKEKNILEAKSDYSEKRFSELIEETEI